MLHRKQIPTINSFLRLFTTVNHPTPFEFNFSLQRLRVHPTHHHLEQLLSSFFAIPTPLSSQTYATLFHACARLNRLDIGKKLHHHMLSHDVITATTAYPVKSHKVVSGDSYVYIDFTPTLGGRQTTKELYAINHLVNMYAKCGDLECAHHLFDEMPERNVVSWTSLISGYAQYGKIDRCFRLFSNMLDHCRPNDFSYASVLSVCDGSRGKQVHALAIKTGFDTCVYVGNALIAMYSRNSSMGGNHSEAWKVFNDMEFHNLVSWNTIIALFQMCGQGDKAMRFFSVMHRDGLGFDCATLVSVLCSLLGMDEIDFSWGLQSCFQLHCVTVKTGLILDVGIVTALVKAYSILRGEVSDCYKLFLETNGCQDLVLWTEIIVAFSERDPEKAILLFGQLHREGLSLDSYAFSIALKACAGLVTDRNALMVHCEVIKSGFVDAVVLGNALIHAYARCGSISQANQVFKEMRYRDIVSWNSMLKAYALHGKANEALGLFGKMDVKPDATTFVALLSACSHAGMVEEGIQIFDSMFEKHGIVPQLDHYACIVDIVGRAGHIFQAEKIIKEMPMQPDYVVWSAFLGACRKHRESGLAQIAASRLKDLDPGNSLGYVLMSNVYCSAHSFDEAGHLRKQMRRLGVTKQPGLSWTEVGGLVHEFASGGLQHPDRKAIYTKLEDFVKELKHIGYIPEITSSLHDIEEEQKEEQLYYHSEKLALIYALLDASRSPSSCCAIKIIKNIRICLDCHNFMKLSSKLIEREIVVRDSNRFHHFKNGACSCNDYW
ncbi:pentatricopeptide repeat-containing protein At1g71420 [Lycium barbarum]|uniref:pentatricopeptide repeat-containing protein At1g71420 n=1 Tax=Lycium barbarum TaxID=112863 RepID=UPI00293E6610|nr:pentatricopeptide repeat-containing protein At1g71420 [Lycium barbarum]